MNEEKNPPSTADHVGQAAGGITGAVAGAAIGSPAGPVGVLLGGIAGAIGGWWSGRALAEAAEDITESDEEYYREHFARTGGDRRQYDDGRPSNDRRLFDDARRAYYLGDVASANSAYASFSDVEPDLARGWRDAAGSDDDWQVMRDYASVGFARGRERRRRPRERAPR